VDGFDKDGDSCSVTFEVKESGMYELIIGYAAPYGYKENSLYVNGEFQTNVKFPQSQKFTTVYAGLIPLKNGKNTISIVKSWDGFFLTTLKSKRQKFLP